MKLHLLHAALFTPMSDGRWGLPLIMWGPPGSAKTSTIKQIAKMYGMHLEHLAPGERGEGAFGVTPVPIESKRGASTETTLAYPPPDWVNKLINKDGEEVGIVFLDELNTAPPALQPALLGAIQERRIGGHEFGPRVRVIGAANPVSQSAGGWDIAPPVANRLGHIEWPAPDGESWSTWLLSGGQETLDASTASSEEERVMRAFPEAFAKACGLVTAFIRRRPELLHKMPADGDPAQSRAWPSPRTWEYATRAYATAMVHGLNDIEKDELITSFIGPAAAGEWATFIEDVDLPDPASVLDGKTKWSHDTERLDRSAAVLSACAALVTPEKAEKRNERAKALWKILEEVMKDAKDIVVPSMKAMVDKNLQKVDPSTTTILAKMHSVIGNAGFRGR